jgi:hypothetical protein
MLCSDHEKSRDQECRNEIAKTPDDEGSDLLNSHRQSNMIHIINRQRIDKKINHASIFSNSVVVGKLNPFRSLLSLQAIRIVLERVRMKADCYLSI